jgi:hypothetical protein
VATELRAYTATIPAGTPQAAPVSVDLSFAPMVTDRIEWHQPRGANGLMGWRLTSGGAQVIPKNPGSFIITDGQTGTWELAALHDSGKWELTGYNLGTFPHVVNVRFHVRPIPETGLAASPLAWLSASTPGRMLAEVGTLANASASVSVPGAVLWPPVRP